MEVSNLTKQRIISFLEKGKRFDGRGLLDYRDLSVDFNISINAEGSARVKLGNTEVIAGVKMSVGTPYTDSQDSGVLSVNSEFNPMASEKFEPGPPSIGSIELARIVDRGIRESGFIDFSKLCITAGEAVWMVNLDIYPVNDAGNLIDASAMAAVAALSSAVFPKLEEGNKVAFGEFTTKRLPLNENMPIALTFHKIGKSIVLDPTVEEEESSDARLTLAISTSDKEDYINALQKGKETPFSVEELHYIIDNAFKQYKTLMGAFAEKLKKKK